MKTEEGTGVGSSKARAGMVRRPFRVLDAMILVAATAICCGIIQWIDQATGGDISWSGLRDAIQELSLSSSGEMRGKFVPKACLLVLWLLFATMPLIVMWTLALIPIRLLAPRPRFHRLACQPGMMAAYASGVACAFSAVPFAVSVSAHAWEHVASSDFDRLVLVSFPMFMGLAISVSWMALLLGGRWHAERSWVDRLGRAIGASGS